MTRILVLATAVALMAFGIARAADRDMNGGSSASLPTFEQIDTQGLGQITPDEAAAAGVTIDWSEADPQGSGHLTKSQYEQAVTNGYVHSTGPAAPSQEPSESY